MEFLFQLFFEAKSVVASRFVFATKIRRMIGIDHAPVIRLRPDSPALEYILKAEPGTYLAIRKQLRTRALNQLIPPAGCKLLHNLPYVL